MIDAQIARATCQIKCGDKFGTGWLITTSHVLTARHCVDDAIDGDARIDAQFEIDGVAQDVTATVVEEDKALDACVLLLEREMDVAPILLDETLPAEGGRFSAFGFPVAKLSVGHRLEGSISRVLDSPKLGMDLDLQVDAPATLTNYEGISGAALICNDSCRGMLRIAVDKSLGAVSIARMSALLRKHSIPLGNAPDNGVNDRALASREEFTKAFDSLVSTLADGYAFIEGAHGIGKSTFCETYQPSLPTLEHFGTYSFTHRTGGGNPMHLAQPEVFFDWLNTLVSSHLTGKAGRVSAKRYTELIVGVQRLLDVLAQVYSSQGKIGVIFVDGLDEAAKLGQDTLQRFVGLLPPAMPAGLALVVSAPSYVNLSAALGAKMTSHSCIAMPGLTREASRAFCASALLPERASAATVRIICDRAQGHALYLRYLIDLANDGADGEHLAALPLIKGSIRNYYEALWPQLLADTEAVNLLAIVVRLRWGVPTEQLADILNDAERAVLVTTLARIQHLMLRRDETTIYHSSFSDFLIEKTALRELDVQRRLADYCATHPDNRYGTLNTVYHGLRAGQTEETRAVANCNQDWVDRCVTVGAEPDALLRDADEALAAAAKQGGLVEVIRLLLLAQRIQFRYDTLFALSADLAADALVALGKTQEALQHAVRYGRLIVPVHLALRLALQLTAADESEAALDILDKAEAVIERQLSNEGLTIGNFVTVFELRTQALLLRGRAGDEAAWRTLPNFYRWSIDAIRNNVEDEKGCNDCLSEMASYFGGSMACLAGRYTPLSVLREYHLGATAGLDQILLRLLADYWAFCSHFGVAYDRRLLDEVFSDVQTLFDELGQECEQPSLGIVDAIVSLGAPTTLVFKLADPAGNLTPLQFVAADNINMDKDHFASGMAQWRLASLLDKDLPCPASSEIQPSAWRDGVDSICRALAWCDGATRRAKESGDEASLQSAWALLEQRVFERLRFTLAQRALWKDSYAVPEAVFPEVYERLTRLVAEVFPERLGDVLSFIDERFAVQCGLYSEGFRSILVKVLERVTELPLGAEVENQAFALLRRWRDFVQSNVKNRHELVPELLTVIPLFVRLNAAEEAHRTYQTVLSFSMGPSWYKEDQLSLMTGALQRVPLGEPLEAGILPRVAGSLEAASGEMTFQRFVRYDKAALLGVLCQRADYLKAVRYFLRQTCGTAEQLLAEAADGEIDRTAPLRGMRFPGGALDEQDALYRMLESAIPSANWPVCWALLEIYQFGDARHLGRSAKAYARLAAQAREESGALAAMVERLKIICEGEFGDEQSAEFLSALRGSLPPDLLKSFEEVLDEVPLLTGAISSPEAHGVASDGDSPESNDADGEAQDGSARDAFVMPGMFGTSDSSRESGEALARAERQLARGNVSTARTEAVAALEYLQRGGWSIWGDLSSGADRAEAILLQGADSADAVVKLYAPLILGERYADKWRRADHLIDQIAGIATREQRAALVRLVVEHVETIVGDAAAKTREYQFLEETRSLDASSCLIELLLAAIEHPQWLRRDKAAEMVLWLLRGHPQYIPMVGPMAFSMASGNLPEVLCGVLEHLSIADATHLWDQLAPALDMDDVQRNCKHVGRLAVLLRIADRAAKKGAASAAAALERVRAAFPQSSQGAAIASPTQVQCPPWALCAELEWNELTAMGLATEELVARAATLIQEACAPLSAETTIELERLLAEGFRNDQDHPLGRWKAKARYALQVALLPLTPEELLPRVDRTFRAYNPARLEHLRILGFSSPSADWLVALSGARIGIEPARGNDVYLDFLERVWDGDRFRILRLTAFLYDSNASRPLPPTPAAAFLSTELPTSRDASRMDACARVEWRPAFFGSFTPAVPSAAFMQMTGATGADLIRAHWRIGRTSPTKGGVPEHEGCFLAIKRVALRLPRDVRMAWVYEIDGLQLGTISRS